MEKNLLNIETPEIFKENDKSFFKDFITNELKEVTPKEVTIQKMLIFIKNNMGFFENIVTNIPLSLYGVKTSAICDIIIEENTGFEMSPCIIISCLPEDLDITDEIIDTAIDVSDMAMAEFFIITNLKEIQMYEYDSKENTYYLLNEPLTKDEILEIMFE